MNTYQRLKDIIIAKGILSASAVHLNADLSQDLSYNLGDVAELARLIEKSFSVQIDFNEYNRFVTVCDIVHFLNSKQIERDFTQPFSDHSTFSF